MNSTTNDFDGQEVSIGLISKIVNFHPIDLKFEEDLDIKSLNSTTNYFWGQHRPKVNNLGAISIILNFLLIDLKFESGQSVQGCAHVHGENK